MTTPARRTARWDEETVFTDADVWFSSVLEAINMARHHVVVETYILADDRIGRMLVAALQAAASRGIPVRLLIDGAGSAAWISTLTAGFPGASHTTQRLRIRVWHPLPWVIARKADLHQRWRWLIHLNRRGHRKVAIIDDAAWIGSINWTSVHSATDSGAHAWRDTACRVTGSGIATIASAIEHAWSRSWPLIDGQLRMRGLAAPRSTPPDEAVRLNHTMRIRRACYRDLLERLRGARSRIWITNAYVIPRGSLLRALRAAAGRGVDVRVLLPGISDHPVMPWVAALFADSIFAAGAKAWSYQPRILHAKTMLIDDQALIGSFNLNSRSFFHDLECEVVLRHPGSITAMEAAWHADQAQAEPISTSSLVRLRWWQRLIAQAALMAKYWL